MTYDLSSDVLGGHDEEDETKNVEFRLRLTCETFGAKVLVETPSLMMMMSSQ